MVDREAFDRRLRLLDRRIALLREIAAAGHERFGSDPHLQAEAERHLQIAIQAAIDAGHQLLAEEFSEAPETYRQVFELLGRRGVIDAALAPAWRSRPAFEMCSSTPTSRSTRS